MAPAAESPFDSPTMIREFPQELFLSRQQP